MASQVTDLQPVDISSNYVYVYGCHVNHNPSNYLEICVELLKKNI